VNRQGSRVFQSKSDKSDVLRIHIDHPLHGTPFAFAQPRQPGGEEFLQRTTAIGLHQQLTALEPGLARQRRRHRIPHVNGLRFLDRASCIDCVRHEITERRSRPRLGTQQCEKSIRRQVRHLAFGEGNGSVSRMVLRGNGLVQRVAGETRLDQHAPR